MRDAFVGTLFAVVLICPDAIAAPNQDISNAKVMPETPSGVGDPNTIVCRAPQQIGHSGEYGPKACGHNFEWWQLTSHGKDLAADGKTVIERKMVANPKGEGNPDAVTCREPKYLAGPSLHIQHQGPEVCQTNRFWADLIRNGKVVDAQGAVVSTWMSTIITGPAASGSYSDPRAAYYVGSR
jgi:hypothetical protein